MRVAICGPLGSGCTEVGQLLSQRLGIKCVSTSDFVRGIVSDFKESFSEFELHTRSGEVDLDKMIAGELSDLLNLGDVIVEGRSGFMLIEDVKTFKVLLVASEDERAKHVAKRRGINMDEALRTVQSSDKERKHMVERLFNKDWLNPANYDLVINTRGRNFDYATDIIFRVLELRPRGT